MSAKEIKSLDTLLPPSGQSLRELTHRIIHYQILVMRETQILQNDRDQLDALNKALEESPDRDRIAIVKSGRATPRPSNMPRDQQERWSALQEYHTFLEKEPISYEEYVFLLFDI